MGGAKVAMVLGVPDESVREALVEAGLDVLTTTEPSLREEEAKARPAILVLDDERPRAERLATQLWLSSQPSLAGVPLLVVSADCSIDSFGSAIAAGAAAFVPRPIVAFELAEVAQRLAHWRSPWRPGDIRRGTRRPLLLAVDVDAAEQKEVRGRIVDVSASGCRLELPCPMGKGAHLGIVPRSCTDSTEIRLAGTVRWSRPAGGHHLVAVRWTGTAGLVARRLLGIASESPA